MILFDSKYLTILRFRIKKVNYFRKFNMKKWFRRIWHDPANKFWLIFAFAGLFVISFAFYIFFNQYLNSVASLAILLASLLFELVFFGAIIVNTFADTKQDYLEAFQTINRDIRYSSYQKKNKDKDYKGPNWEDDEFKNIEDLKQRVDAFVKASIEYQKVDFERWKKRNVDTNISSTRYTIIRSFWIIVAAITSVAILIGLLNWIGLDASDIKDLITNSKATVILGILTTFIATPVIFMVWIFRDKNTRVQIENARKDTNLKDFQKLSEWASGFHLPEIKHTKTIKNELKDNKENEGIKKEFKEESESNEYFIAPDSSHNISRRQGAEALQASAIAQLEAFMLGKYGEQFMQPAFLLIHAIWESIITQQQMRFPDEEEFNNTLNKLHKNPIVAALNRALAGADGKHLRLFENNLIGLNLTGINSSKPPIKSLDLANCNLQGIKLENAILAKISLQGANLNFAYLKGVYLEKSDLQNASLEWAMTQNSNLREANLHCANLDCIDLQNANLKEANLKGAQLFGAMLQYTKFQGADLRDIEWNSVHLHNTEINRRTTFGNYDINLEEWIKEDIIRENLLLQGAIWDDDPHWLVDKIQDKKLLEKIIHYRKVQQNDDLPF